ncbi:TPA: hypothetical protein N0F65_000616 [Lagenidium giganteum]|uniref:Cyclic nucleotide-binding domain-containing protein n=1 Tax=Lagenidium giganteum TaxID=4803 RepID=A0AAV2YPF8_9STRA|nr:TPA: hypothetical protein N0F65_000616 [Lagenidium giganteum]
MSGLESNEIWGSAEEGVEPEILLMSNDELRQRIRLLDNDIRIMRSDIQRINHESNSQRERIKENNEKVKLNKQLPYLVGNIVEILQLEDDEDEQDGAATDVDAQRRGKSAVIKTSTRQTVFLPIPGLVETSSLEPNDLVGTNKDSYLILEKLPAEYDSRVKAMELVRDAFDLAKEKCKEKDRGGAIIFIDEIELPHPTEEARARILQIHSRKMNVDMEEVNFDELARCTDDFNGAQLKAVCVEAGMLALRRESNIIKHEDFMEGIGVVSAKKKASLHSFDEDRRSSSSYLIPSLRTWFVSCSTKQNVLLPLTTLTLWLRFRALIQQLDLDAYYQTRLRRRTHLESEIVTSLAAGGLSGVTAVPNAESAPHEQPSLAKARGLRMTLSPGEEYENYQKVFTAQARAQNRGFMGEIVDDDDDRNSTFLAEQQQAIPPEVDHEQQPVRTKATIADSLAQQRAIASLSMHSNNLKSQLIRQRSAREHAVLFTANSSMLNPHGRFRLVWDVVSIFFIFYNALSLPFQASFDSITDDDDTAFDSFLDMFFGTDILLTFNTAVEMQGSIRYNRRIAAMQYLKSWFLVDAVAAFPYAHIVSAVSGDTKLRRSLKLLRLIRLLRLLRISRIFRRIQNAIFIRSTLSALLKYLLLVMFLAHWFSCLFHAVGQAHIDEDDNWVRINNLTDRYCNKWDRYVAALYFSVMTLATIGYGDISGTNPDERLISIVFMVVGGGVFAYGITNIVELVSSLTVVETRFREKMDEVNEYMEARELPIKLRMEIREFYHNTRLSRDSKLNAEHQILNELSSKLRSKVALSINDQFLRKFPFFAGSDPNFLLELALNMRMIHFAPLEDVILENEIGHEMFFIFRGAVEVLKSGNQIGILGENQYFGEMAILSPDNRRTATVRTLCFCELRMLSRNRFLDALTLFPAMQAKMAEVAQGRAAPIENSILMARKTTSTSITHQISALERKRKSTGKGPGSPTAVPMMMPLARVQQVEKRETQPFITAPPARTTMVAGRHATLRRSSAPTSGISTELAQMLSDTSTALEEATRRHEALLNRVLRLQSEIQELIATDDFIPLNPAGQPMAVAPPKKQQDAELNVFTSIGSPRSASVSTSEVQKMPADLDADERSGLVDSAAAAHAAYPHHHLPRAQKGHSTVGWTIGVIFLIIVAFIWTFASVLVQYIFHELSFQGPFFLTYVGITLFSVNLPCWYVSQIIWPQLKAWCRGQGDRPQFLHCELLKRPANKASYWEIFKISATISPLWFLANWTYNMSLNMTSVTSSTIVSSTSTVFTFLLSVIVLKEQCMWMKVFGVALCMAGNISTIFKDSGGSDAAAAHESVLGDLVALFAAFMYGVYTTAIRRQIPDEERVSISLFFGFLGVINFVCLLPFVVVFHYTGYESLSGLSSEIVLLICLKGLFDNVLSDYLWARAVLLTSPTVATVGLSLTVPLAILSDYIFHHMLPTFVTIGASVLVVSGFILINVSTKKDKDRVHAAEEEEEAQQQEQEQKNVV